MDNRETDEPRWICPNCGQTYFGEDPPDMCDYCGDFTTWRRLPEQKTPPELSSTAEQPRQDG